MQFYKVSAYNLVDKNSIHLILQNKITKINMQHCDMARQSSFSILNSNTEWLHDLYATIIWFI